MSYRDPMRPKRIFRAPFCQLGLLIKRPKKEGRDFLITSDFELHAAAVADAIAAAPPAAEIAAVVF